MPLSRFEIGSLSPHSTWFESARVSFDPHTTAAPATAAPHPAHTLTSSGFSFLELPEDTDTRRGPPTYRFASARTREVRRSKLGEPAIVAPAIALTRSLDSPPMPLRSFEPTNCPITIEYAWLQDCCSNAAPGCGTRVNHGLERRSSCGNSGSSPGAAMQSPMASSPAKSATSCNSSVASTPNPSPKPTSTGLMMFW